MGKCPGEFGNDAVNDLTNQEAQAGRPPLLQDVVLKKAPWAMLVQEDGCGRGPAGHGGTSSFRPFEEEGS